MDEEFDRYWAATLGEGGPERPLGAQFPHWTAERLAAHGWRATFDLDQGLVAWAGLVRQCEAGYGFCLDEFTNDLHVRDQLDVVFTRGADALPGVDDVREQLRLLDDRFRALLRPDVTAARDGDRWWRAGILRRGGAEIARDIEDQFGVEVEVVA